MSVHTKQLAPISINSPAPTPAAATDAGPGNAAMVAELKGAIAEGLSADASILAAIGEAQLGLDSGVAADGPLNQAAPPVAGLNAKERVAPSSVAAKLDRVLSASQLEAPAWSAEAGQADVAPAWASDANFMAKERIGPAQLDASALKMPAAGLDGALLRGLAADARIDGIVRGTPGMNEAARVPGRLSPRELSKLDQVLSGL